MAGYVPATLRVISQWVAKCYPRSKKMKGVFLMREIQKVEYNGTLVLTTQQIAEAYGTTDKIISNNFKRCFFLIYFLKL